jgi:rRNA maturation protein Rpf1
MQEHKMARKKKTEIPSLSSVEAIPNNISTKSTDTKDEVVKKVFDAVSNLELQKGIDKWLKENKKEELITNRDLGILKGIITEYLDAFLMVAYTPRGERVILQNFKSARDRDAIMEFFKTVFIKQQHDNFLDEE